MPALHRIMVDGTTAFDVALLDDARTVQVVSTTVTWLTADPPVSR